MSRRIGQFEDVEFARGHWKAFETFATDFLTNTSALPLAVVGAYGRLRASFWAYGNGWSLEAPIRAWLTHTGALDAAEFDAAVEALAQRGLIIVERGEATVALADPFMHADLLRKQRARDRTARCRAIASERQEGAPPKTSRVTSRATSRATPRVTSELPPSSVPSPRSQPASPTATSDSVDSPTGGEDRSPAAIQAVKSSDIDAVIEHYRDRHPMARPGGRERALIATRLKDGYAPAELILAIDGCHSSAYHCGENPSRTKYQRLDLIFRDAAHVQQFMELAKRGPAAMKTDRPRTNEEVSREFLSRLGIPTSCEESNHGST